MNDITIARELSKPELDALRGGLAVAYVGLPVFPCNAEKRPTTERGFNQASRSPLEVRKLWEQYPGGVLVGVPTGILTNLSVVDIDAKHSEARDWFEANRARLGRTRVHRTRSGGLHLLYSAQLHLNCSVSKLARGVDIRSDGGYVIWWPAHGCAVLDNGDPAPFPGWLWEALKPPPPPPRGPLPPPKRGQRDDNVMRGLVRRLVSAANGERNAMLFWCACRAAEHVLAGEVREGYALECLELAANHIGLPRARGKENHQKRNASGGEMNKPIDSNTLVSEVIEESTRYSWEAPDWSVLDDRRGELPDFPLDIFSDRIRGWVKRSAHGAGGAADHVAVPLLGIASGLIGTARRVRASKSWSEPCAIWTAIVGNSGTGKTPGMEVTKRALDRVEETREPEIAERQRKHEERAERATVELKQWKKAMQEALEAKQPPPKKPASADAVGDFVMPRLYVSDVTIAQGRYGRHVRSLSVFMAARACVSEINR
jgi:hypothetical protein